MTRVFKTGAAAGVVLAAAALFLTACGSDDASAADDLLQADTTVAYTFIGPSTAPNFHKEYVIQFAGKRATARIGGYGVVSGEAEPAKTTTADVSADQWKQLVDGLDALANLPKPADGCVGGSTYGIHVNSAGRSVVNRTDAACGPTAADVAGRYESLIASIRPALQLP